MKTSRLIILGVLLSIVFIALVSCGAEPINNAQDSSQKIAQNRVGYTPVHDVEGQNYYQRLRLADNPSTILWCTLYPAQAGIRPITYPIVGKLTSGSKRPYPTTKASGTDLDYYPEIADGQGMYGSSSDYQYGFDTGGNFHQFGGMEYDCSNEPSIYQRESTTIVTQADPDLLAAQQQAQAILAQAGDDPTMDQYRNAIKQASAIIDAAVRKAGGK